MSLMANVPLLVCHPDLHISVTSERTFVRPQSKIMPLSLSHITLFTIALAMPIFLICLAFVNISHGDNLSCSPYQMMKAKLFRKSLMSFIQGKQSMDGGVQCSEALEH